MTLKSRWSTFAAAGLASVFALNTAAAQSGSQTVDTRTSLFLAGGNVYDYTPNGGGGLVPTSILLTAGTGRVLTLNATGSSFYCGPGVCLASTPDGPAIGGTNVNSMGFIGGISAPTSGFLAALFLGPSLPSSLPAQTVITDINAASYAPGLGQIFFVGNGSTASSVLQQFMVPDGATRLYFGIADAGGFVGRPEFYDDNVGSFSVDFTVTSMSAVPEPSTVALLSVGLAVLGVARRRRAA